MKQPQKGMPPPLEDPNNVREIFATEVAGVGVGYGCMFITLAVERHGTSVDEKLKAVRRVVVGRVVLTAGAANSLRDQLNKLAVMTAAVQTPAASEQKN